MQKLLQAWMTKIKIKYITLNSKPSFFQTQFSDSIRVASKSKFCFPAMVQYGLPAANLASCIMELCPNVFLWFPAVPFHGGIVLNILMNQDTADLGECTCRNESLLREWFPALKGTQ